MDNSDTSIKAFEPQSSRTLNPGLKVLYNGKTIAQTCAEGNLPVTAMLVAEGADAGIDMMLPDEHKCTLLHYAALGGNIDLIKYVRKKGKNRDVDERNSSGETALLRCAIQGNIKVALLLLQEGAKLLAVDNKKQFISEMQIENDDRKEALMDILSGEDAHGHTALEWACYCGHLNVFRYLHRLGLDPSRRDANGKSCLHWAALRGQVDICYYLSRLDMPASMWAQDADGISPQQYLYRIEKNKYLWEKDILLLPYQQSSHSGRYCSRWLGQRRKRRGEQKTIRNEKESSSLECQNGGDVSVFKIFHDFQEPSIWGMNHPRLWIVACYALLVCGLWAISFVAPSWSWFIIVALVIGLLVAIGRMVKAPGKIHQMISSPYVVEFFSCQEKLFSIWLGIVLSFIAYVVLIGLRLSGATVENGDDFPGHSLQQGWTNVLIWLEVVFFIGMIATWLLLFFVFFDPGRIESSCPDFIEMSKEVVVGLNPPDTSKFCYTCLIRKPLRSKHCPICGICVARMDHHCIWLNVCIGYLNHKPFILFLVCHALASIVWSLLSILAWSREIPNDTSSGDSNACQAVQDIFSTDYFPTLILGILAMPTSVFLILFICDQLKNIAQNITTNEKINRRRYSWLRTPTNGTFFNWYDRGFRVNCMEFWQPASCENACFTPQRSTTIVETKHPFPSSTTISTSTLGLLFPELFSSQTVASSTAINDGDRIIS